MYRAIASKLTKSIEMSKKTYGNDNLIVWITKRIYFKAFVYKLLLLFKAACRGVQNVLYRASRLTSWPLKI